MHVLFVSGEFRPHSTFSGGIGTHFAAFAEGLIELGHDVTAVTRQPKFQRSITPSGIEIVGIPDPPRGGPFRSLTRAARIAKYVRSQPGDVIVAPEWDGEAAFLVDSRPLVTVLETSAPQLKSLEPDNWVAPKRRVEIRAQEFAERRQTLRSDAVVASSRAIGRWASDLWPIRAERLSVLPNFLDIPAIQTIGGTRGTLDPGVPYVFYFGRLEPRKGVHFLAEAMNRVWQTHPEVRLVLAGADREFGNRLTSEVIREIVGEQASNIDFLGNVDPSDLLPLASGAQAVVFPSLWENFSLGAIEAMAVGSTIIATTGSGFVDFMTDAEDALLVPPKDVAALGGALLRVISDRTLAEALGGAARKRAEDDLNLTTGTQRFVDLFETLIP